MKLSQLKKLIKEIIIKELSEIEPDSPTGMFAVNLADQQTPASQQKYFTIVNVKSYQDPEPMKLVKMKGPDAAIDYLSKYDQGVESDVNPSTTPPWGSNDKTFDRGDYILFWNESVGYVGLVRTNRASQTNSTLGEMSTTGGVSGFQTPYAFSKRNGSERALAASTGYTKVGKNKNSKNRKE